MNKELTFKNHENGMKVAKALLDESYCVMLSYEGDLLVVNYEYSHYSDRNDMVFMRRDEYEEELDKISGEVYQGIRTDIKEGLYKDLSDI